MAFTTALLVVLILLPHLHQATSFIVGNPTRSTFRLSAVSIAREERTRASADREQKAKQTWTTIALQPVADKEEVTVDLMKESDIYNQQAFAEFCSSVKGTYYINGLASCKVGNRILHPFEAHGHCKSFVFDGSGSMKWRGRIVETPLTKKEFSQQNPIARGVMSTVASTQFPTNFLNMMAPSERDTASLVSFLWPPPSGEAGCSSLNLICICDNGEPYVLHPTTLKTRGLLVDVVPSLRQHLDGKKLLAHYRIADNEDTLVLCASALEFPGEFNTGNATMEFLEFDSNFELLQKRNYTTSFLIFHDWQLSEDYYIVPRNPAILQKNNLIPFVLGLKVGTEIFCMDEEANSGFILIPRDLSKPVLNITVDRFFNIFHFGPVQQSTNELEIYASVFDSYQFGREMGYCGEQQKFEPIDWATSGEAPSPRLDRFVVDMDSSSLVDDERIRVGCDTDDIPVDMPAFVGSKYAYFLGASRPEGWFPFRSIVKMNLPKRKAVNWDAGDDCVMSEPMFVPRPTSKSEDDGYVLSIRHDASTKSCAMMIWDSPNFGGGPIATIPLGELMPWCVHGHWYPEYIPS